MGALPNGHLLMAWDDLANAYTVEVDPARSFRVVRSSKFKGFVTQSTGFRSYEEITL